MAAMQIHLTNQLPVAAINVDQSDCWGDSPYSAKLYVEAPLLEEGQFAETAPSPQAVTLLARPRVARVDLGEGRVLLQQVRLSRQGETWSLICCEPYLA